MKPATSVTVVRMIDGADEDLRNERHQAGQHRRQIADSQHSQGIGDCEDDDQPKKNRPDDADQPGRDQRFFGGCKPGSASVEESEQRPRSDTGKTRDDDACNQDRNCDYFVPGHSVIEHSRSLIRVYNGRLTSSL